MAPVHKQLGLPIVAILMGALSGCAVTPSSIVQQPTTVRAQMLQAPQAQNGSIYQASTFRPLFEDRRARSIGDLITVTIVEKTNAAKQGSNSGSKSNSLSASVPNIFGRTFAGGEISTKSSSKIDAKDASAASNTFTSTLTATVTDVLPNGNMVISGEKQVAFDDGVEYIRFSGVVSPANIGAGNTILSTQIADVRAEYRTDSRVDGAAVMGYLTRFFFSVLPF